MGIEITEKIKETRVKQASMLNTQRSLFGLNGYANEKTVGFSINQGQVSTENVFLHESSVRGSKGFENPL